MIYKDLLVDTISIEVTRRCNMLCPHCMCGDAQNIDIDLSYISEFLQQFRGKHIRHITFTGGEPSLNVDAIAYTLNTVIDYEIAVDMFSIITNGYNLSDDFITTCNNWISYCKNNGLVLVSKDKYHRELSSSDLSKLNKLTSYTYWFTAYYDSNIISKGRAKENNIGVSSFKHKSLFNKLRSYSNILVYTGIVLLNCLGNVLYNCDYVFRDEEYKYYLCNYDDNLFACLRLALDDIDLPSLGFSFDYFSTYQWLKREGY